MDRVTKVKAWLAELWAPAVSVIVSPEADALCQAANGLSVVSLLRPFGVLAQLNGSVGGGEAWPLPRGSLLLRTACPVCLLASSQQLLATLLGRRSACADCGRGAIPAAQLAAAVLRGEHHVPAPAGGLLSRGGCRRKGCGGCDAASSGANLCSETSRVGHECVWLTALH